MFYSPSQYRDRSEIWQEISRSSSARVEQVRAHLRSLLQNDSLAENLISKINLENTPEVSFAQFLRCSDPDLVKAVSVSQSRRAQRLATFHGAQNPQSQPRIASNSGKKNQSQDKRGVTSPLKVTFRAQQNPYQSPPKSPGVKIEIVKPAIPLSGFQNPNTNNFHLQSPLRREIRVVRSSQQSHAPENLGVS